MSILEIVGWDIPNLYAKSHSMSPLLDLHNTKKNSFIGESDLDDPEPRFSIDDVHVYDCFPQYLSPQ